MPDALGVEHPALTDAAAAGVRIVSLVPSITELLFALGLGPLVVGRTSFCVHPPEAGKVPRVGGTKTVRVDRLLALSPTHVIVNVDENTRETAEAIGAGGPGGRSTKRPAARGPAVVVTHPLGPEDNLALYRMLGALFGREREAEALCEAFENGLRALRAARLGRARRRVLYLIWRDPWMTVSRDTYVSRTLALAGWDTVGGSEHVRYPQVALGPPLAAGLDLVLLSSEPYPFKAKHFDEVRAALAGAADRPWAGPLIRLIDGEMTSWYGSRAIAGLDYLARLARDVDDELETRPAGGGTGGGGRLRAP